MIDEDDSEESVADIAEGFTFAAAQGPGIHLRCETCGDVWAQWARHERGCARCGIADVVSEGVPYEGPTQDVECPTCGVAAVAPVPADRALCDACGTSYPV